MELIRAILFVKDFETMAAFYRDALGLPEVAGTAAPGWVELGAGAARFGIHAIPEPIAATIEIANPPVPREDTPIKLVFRVDDLEAERARLIACGVAMGDLRPWGSCDGIDPEGNVFQLVEARL